MRTSLFLLCGLLGCSMVPLDRTGRPGAEVASRGSFDGLWVIQIRRQSWQPRDLEFLLRVEAGGGEPRGTATLDPVFIGRTTAALVELEEVGQRVQFTLDSPRDGITYRFDGRRDGATLDGTVRWNDGKRDHVDHFAAFQREVRRFDVELGRFPVETDPRAVGVEPVLLDRLVLGAENARSDAIVVVSEGRLVAARTFGGSDAAAVVGSLDAELGDLLPHPVRPPAALELRPSEVAALGQALLDGGAWTGAPVVDSDLLDAFGRPAALDPAHSEVGWTHLRHPRERGGRPLGFGHLTGAGEGLLVYPEARLVVVRTLQRQENRYDRRYDERAGMEWLQQMSEAIAVAKTDAAPQSPVP